MKLLIITAVQSFQGDIQKILKSSKISAYSRLEVTGFKDLTSEPQDSNWFASSGGEHRSEMFYAFIEESSVGQVLEAIRALNATQETASSIHAAVMDIDQIV